MRQKQAKISEGYIPTIEDIAENRRVVEICNYYGIRLGTFSDNDNYNKDEIIALKYINEGKELPTDLANRLLNKKEQRAIKQKEITHNTTEEDVEALFGIKLE